MIVKNIEVRLSDGIILFFEPKAVVLVYEKVIHGLDHWETLSGPWAYHSELPQDALRHAIQPIEYGKIEPCAQVGITELLAGLSPLIRCRRSLLSPSGSAPKQ